MKNKNYIRLTSGVTALALACSLSMTGCAPKNSTFNYSENENGEIVVEEGSYIEYEYLNKYYIIEVYNTLTEENEIYIANRITHGGGRSGPVYHEYVNIFNNFTIAYTNKNYNKNGLEFIEETPLLWYITSYYTLKARYTYEDMQYIYKTIEENYTFNETKSKTRKKEINN